MNWLNMYPQTDYKERLALLREAGWRSQEIARLCQFRHVYQPGEQDRSPLDYAHLLFIRWLVTHGKLSEQMMWIPS